MRSIHWTGISTLLAAFTLGLAMPQPTLGQDTSPTMLLDVEGALEEGDTQIPTDSSLYDEHVFEGQAGQQVTITLESTDFDPYLLVFSTDGEMLGQIDDVSADDLTAQLVLTLPSDGQYIVLANSYDSTGRGQYTLTVSSQTPASPENTPQTKPPADIET